MDKEKKITFGDICHYSCEVIMADIFNSFQ